MVRRKKFGGDTTVKFHEITVFPGEKKVFVHDKPLTLTRSEYELLLYFLANPNRVLSKESLAEHLVGDDADSMDSFDFIYSHIKNLRRKLRQSNDGDYLKAVYGYGYKFTDR